MRITTKFFTVVLLSCVTFLLVKCNSSAADQETATKQTEQYQCLPCGRDCDKTEYNKPGECPHCQMRLVKKSTVTFKSIQPSEICSYITQHPDVVLLDVRTKGEFEGKADPNFGTLKNAINLPIQQLEERLTSISALKEKEIIVYCSHSHRSPQAAYILSQNGFKNIINMAGGMSVMSDRSCIK